MKWLKKNREEAEALSPASPASSPSSSPVSGATADADRLLMLEREAQSLRLELAERERQIASLAGEVERQRQSESARLADAVHAQLERLMSDAAAPVAQLLTQAHLLEAEGKPVQAKDVLAVARRFVRLLEDQGLTIEDRLGDVLAFDPNRHQPLGGGVSIQRGQMVIIRFSGISYRGRVLRKAGVELEK